MKTTLRVLRIGVESGHLVQGEGQRKGREDAKRARAATLLAVRQLTLVFIEIKLEWIRMDGWYQSVRVSSNMPEGP